MHFHPYALRILGGILFACATLGSLCVEAAPSVRVRSPDGSVIAIGDIHGDFEALTRLLHDNGLIDERGNWTGGNRVLVINGDFVGKGLQSFETAHFLVKLQKLASRSGGQVHLLPGNHEWRILQGDLSGLSPRDRKKFREHYEGGAQAAFSSGPLGKWFRNAPLALAVDRTLYVHGDPDARLGRLGLKKANRLFSRWVRYSQGEGPKPPKRSSWLVEEGDEGGPLFGRKLVRRKLTARQLSRLLEAVEVDRIVVGHTPTRSQRIEQLYGGRVLRIDTGISRAVGGKPSAAVVRSLGKQERRRLRRELNGKKGRRDALHPSSTRLPDTVTPRYSSRECDLFRKLGPDG